MIVEVDDRVWVAWSRSPTASRLPADTSAARGLPAWRRREKLAARGLLRATLVRLAPKACAAPLTAQPGGQPALLGWPDLGVSLSHDEDLVAVAIAPGHRVGVDVQLPPAEAAPRMLRRCLRQRADALADLSTADRADELAWVWSVQEACVKADGTGIAGRPWTIDVPPAQPSGRWGDLTWHALRKLSDIPLSCAFGEPAGPAALLETAESTERKA